MRRAPLLLLLASLAACRFPPFDAELSLARLTTEKLDLVGVVGPFAGSLDTKADYSFVPERTVLDDSAPAGWILGTGPGFVGVSYSPGGSAVSGGQWGSGLWQDTRVPTLLASAAAPGRLLLMRLSTPSLWTWIGVLGADMTVADPTSSANDFKGWVASQATFASMIPNVTGIFAYPPDPALPSRLRLRFVAPDSAGTGYEEGEAILDCSATPSLSGVLPAATPVTGLPAAIERTSVYRYSPVTGWSYLSVLRDAGTWDTYRWRDSSAASLFSPGFRLDALLSTGRLLVRDRDIARVYDADGRRLASFPMGALRYAGEYWDSAEGRLRIVFVLPLLTSEEKGEERRLSFEVYSWPTADVTRLD